MPAPLTWDMPGLTWSANVTWDGVTTTPNRTKTMNASAINGTSSNTNAVSTLDTPFANNPPTLADMELMRTKINEVITALRR